MSDPKFTILRPGYGRVEQDGHTAEGRLVATETNIDFSGHFICGPHDADGNHPTPDCEHPIEETEFLPDRWICGICGHRELR